MIVLTVLACFNARAQQFRETARGNQHPSMGMLFLNTTGANFEKYLEPLNMTAEVLGQRYCRSDVTTFTVVLKLRMHFVNQSGEKVIVEKTPGYGTYSVVIARDAKSLAEGKYEYNPSMEMIVEHTGPETPEKFKSPGPEFAILAPGESIHSEREIWAEELGRQHNSAETSGNVSPGNHVLRVTVSTWDFRTKPEEIRKRWQSFGYLVYESISTGPLPFSLPSDPKVDNCN